MLWISLSVLKSELGRALVEGSPEPILDQLIALNPGSPATSGVWRVVHAPHIDKLGRVLATKFEPIFYDLGHGAIESHVRYEGLFGHGWLSTRGTYTYDDVASVHWDDAWFDPQSNTFSAEPDDGAFRFIVRRLAKIAFIPAFAHFPVDYLDDDLVIFRFPLLDSRIVASRIPSVVLDTDALP